MSLEGFSNEIRSAQVEGTLETLLVTPTSVPTILFSSTLYSYSITSLRVIVYIVLGAVLFGLKLHMTSVLSFVVVMILTVASFAGIGLISATHTLKALRQILINGASFAAVYDEILILTVFSALLLPAGLAAFRYGLTIAKKEGSLIHY